MTSFTGEKKATTAHGVHNKNRIASLESESPMDEEGREKSQRSQKAPHQMESTPLVFFSLNSPGISFGKWKLNVWQKSLLYQFKARDWSTHYDSRRPPIGRTIFLPLEGSSVSSLLTNPIIAFLLPSDDNDDSTMKRSPFNQTKNFINLFPWRPLKKLGNVHLTKWENETAPLQRG